MEPKDRFELSDIINSAREKNSLLARPPEKILEIYKNYFIAVDEGRIIGTVGFKIWNESQPEIISLVVLEEYRRLGIGCALLKECIKKIREKNFKTIIA